MGSIKEVFCLTQYIFFTWRWKLKMKNDIEMSLQKCLEKVTNKAVKEIKSTYRTDIKPKNGSYGYGFINLTNHKLKYFKK